MRRPSPSVGDLGQEGGAALDRPLPNLGLCGDDWNTERCSDRMRCSKASCWLYHSEAERRCQAFSRGEPCPVAVGSDGKCPNGLHVHLAEFRRVLEINLDRSEAAMAIVQQLEAESPDERAKVVRMIVWGFAAVGGKLLKKCLQLCPTVHDIILPDRAYNPYTCYFLNQLHEECATSTPRFRDVVFANNQVEPMWH